jgi:peroxiredoxin
MALTYSKPMPVRTSAPEFDLPLANPGAGDRARLTDFSDRRALVVVFTCNHCPYAIHIEDALLAMARRFQAAGVGFLAISSNDAESHPQDGPEAMARRAREKSFPFGYAYDESQAVARAYGAVCTPDPFLFDSDLRLYYHGRFDATRPGMGKATGLELQAAIEACLAGDDPISDPNLSMGCNIKWKPGKS